MNRSPRLRVISFGLLFLLVRSAWAAPPNDSFSNPTIVSGFPATATGSNVDASLQVNESLPDAWDGDGEASVWFGWTAPASGSVRIDTFGSDFDTMLAVWTGTAVDALILLAENDQYDGDQSAVFVSVTAGTTYRIGVYGWLNAQGVIALHITNDILSKISGTVTGPTGTPPLEGISVEARQWNGSRWRLISHANTGASGNYTLGGLTAGTYRVQFDDDNGEYLSEAYSNAPTLDAGMDIVVAAGTTVSNVNAALATASKIAGTVTGPNGTPPLEGIQATAYQWNGDFSDWEGKGWADSDASGNYTIRGLAAGTYRVEFYDDKGEYLSEAYSNAPTLDAGMDIVVAAGTTVSNVNAALATASKIAGTVTGPNGTPPLGGIQATAYQWNGDFSGWEEKRSADSDANGNYAIGGLTAGTYRVEFYDDNGEYLSEAYSNAPTVDAGMDIVVAAETTVSNVNAALATASKIAGTVTGPDGAPPLGGIRATAYQWNSDYSFWESGSSGTTDSNGNYAIGGLTAGTYRVEFQDYSGNYLPEVYSNAPTLDAGMDIVVAAHTTVSNVNAALATASKIAGTVTGPNGTPPLGGIRATAYQWNDDYSEWEEERSANSDASGNYTIRGLTAGTYRVQFQDFSGNYLPEAYSNAPTLDAGMDIAVAAHTTVSNINAALATASKIAGTVTGPNGAPPLGGIWATAYQWDSEHSSWDDGNSGSTDASGNYTIGGLTAGTYRVWFYDDNGDYFSEAYSNALNLASGTDIAVPTGTTVSNINASLARASEISGTVTGPDGTTALDGVRVYVYRWNGEDWAYLNEISTGTAGHYTFGGLAAGTYRIRFEDWSGSYGSETYSNAVDIASGTDIVVPAGATITGIDASLPTWSGISGTVTGPDGTTALYGVWVYVYRWNGAGWDYLNETMTGVGGHYTLYWLSAGTYRVRFEDGSGDYVSEAYSNAVDIASGTDIVVPGGTTVSNINASLASFYATISGTVTGPDGTTALNGVWVYAYRWNGVDWDYLNETMTDAGGHYTLNWLSAGTYRVRFEDGSGEYVSEAYSNAVDIASGTDIVVPTGTTVSNINATLASTYATISGTVTGPDGTAPLHGVWAYAYRWDGSNWQFVDQTATDIGGHYSIGWLAAGTYRVGFGCGSGNYLYEAYNGAADLDSATDFVVPAGAMVSGIDAALAASGDYPSEVAGIQKTGANAFELSIIGTEGRYYMMQWTPSMTGTWVNTGGSFDCGPGNHVIPLAPTGTLGFWRVILAP